MGKCMFSLSEQRMPLRLVELYSIQSEIKFYSNVSYYEDAKQAQTRGSEDIFSEIGPDG